MGSSLQEKSLDDAWQRDFGAERIDNIIQTEFREDDWPKTDSEKTLVELEVDLSKWLSYQNVEKSIPKIKPFLFRNSRTIGQLLQKIQSDLDAQIKDSTLPEIDIKERILNLSH